MPKTRKSARKQKTASPATKATPIGPRPNSKKARLINLLMAPDGADVASISTILAWLPHTTRAALTGLRKQGHTIERLPADAGQPSRYRLTGSPK